MSERILSYLCLKLIFVAFVARPILRHVSQNFIISSNADEQMFVALFILKAVRVQDPPNGLPAAAASSLQLQEPRQGHPLEDMMKKRMRRMDLSRDRERKRERRRERIIVRRGRGHLHLTKLFRCPLPILKTVLFWFSLGQMKTKV